MNNPQSELEYIKMQTRAFNKRHMLFVLLLIITAGLLIPESLIIPVKDATKSDWNHQSFWYAPWGKSGVHKGIDIFASKHTPLLSASKGLVLFTGDLNLGGKVVVILGPKWRVHYYAHLETISTSGFSLVSASDSIGTVGDSGNAKGKQAHLHYSITTLLPYFWRVDRTTQGWMKMFFLDPHEKLTEDSI